MDNPPENEALEEYLDRLCKLFFIMPEAEKAEARDEIRLHLLTMIALHEAEGFSESDFRRSHFGKVRRPTQNRRGCGEGMAEESGKRR